MRRRLSITSFAVTSMVVLAFLVPLGLLVRDLAHDRAISAAEREAEGIARFIAVVGPDRGIDQAVAAIGSGDSAQFEMSVVLADGTILGDPLRSGEDLIAASQGNTARAKADGGEAVYVPVLQSDGSVLIVRVYVPGDVLARGVTTSWLTLGLLGLVLVAIAVFVSDRLAKSIVTPVEELSATAAELGEGNLDARVIPDGPPEIRDVGAEFNRLAQRVEQLLQAERETAADLSHRLRTPLFALRLDVEALPAGPEKTRILDDLDDLVRHVDFVIREARREVRRQPGHSTDLGVLLRERLAYWGALAEEQGRPVTGELEEGPITVAIPPDDLQAAIDALIENAFAHTAEGTALLVSLSAGAGVATLRVEDAGSGFPDHSVLLRGASGGSGTGLGLDIVRRAAESAGGSMSIGTGEVLGGAAVEVIVPMSPQRGTPKRVCR